MGEIYHLMPHERSTLDELPSNCEVFYGDYPSPLDPKFPAPEDRKWSTGKMLCFAFGVSALLWAILILTWNLLLR